MVQLPEFTDEQKGQQDEAVIKAIVASDGELQALLDLMFGRDDEHEGGYFGITLVVDGGVISGTAITEAAWSKALDESLTQAGAAGAAADRQRIASKADEGFAAIRESRKSGARPTPPRRFIHMKTASTDPRSGGASLVNVRVDLTKVSAWSLGSWMPIPPSTDN